MKLPAAFHFYFEPEKFQLAGRKLGFQFADVANQFVVVLGQTIDPPFFVPIVFRATAAVGTNPKRYSCVTVRTNKHSYLL